MFLQFNRDKKNRVNLKPMILMIGFMLAPLLVYIMGVVLFSKLGRKFPITNSYAYSFSFIVCISVIYKSKLRYYIVFKKPQLKIVAIYLVIALIYGLIIACLFITLSTNQSASGNALIYANAIIMAPILEEVVFRGIAIEYLKKSNIPDSLIIALTSFMFGLSHMPSLMQTHTFISGIILSIVYLKERNLFYCILIHFCINLLFVILKL